jgi:hypothetical protein
MNIRSNSLVAGFNESEGTHPTTNFLYIRPGKLRDLVRGLAFLRHYMYYMYLHTNRCFPPFTLRRDFLCLLRTVKIVNQSRETISVVADELRDSFEE